MKNIFRFFVLFFLFSCVKQDLQVESSIEGQEICALNDIKLISPSAILLPKDTCSRTTAGIFHPLYIGEKKTEIETDYWNTFQNFKLSFSFRYAKPQDINIFVDTSRIIRSVTREYIRPPLPDSTDIQDWFSENGKYYVSAVQAYPVFIENLADDTLTIGAGNGKPYVSLKLEGIDSTGKWSKIQNIYMHRCGNGLKSLYLPSNNILITSCRLFEGNYRTKMRLASPYTFEDFIYSNEFWGTVNYKQFNLNSGIW